MTTFLVLLYATEGYWEVADEATKDRYYREHGDYADRAPEFGVTFLASEALQPVATAVTLRRSGADATVTEGPFAETVEQLGGFYLVTAPDRESVLAHALLLPEYSIEVREIMQV
ncbi:YciI family protein [Cellulomonas sp. ICMP 17802]|uniref:YciI family protein n=1 Tax=Cellulomonas sp. ICMP 17802 TaxID=3239199 RepID=UPI00351B062B